MIGERGKRGNRQLVVLYLVVAEANDVMVNVATDSTFVLGFGYPADLEVVEQLWASLATQMASAAARRLRAGEHRKAGIAAVSWRLSFYEGWMHAVQAAAGARPGSGRCAPTTRPQPLDLGRAGAAGQVRAGPRVPRPGVRGARLLARGAAATGGCTAPPGGRVSGTASWPGSASPS